MEPRPDEEVLDTGGRRPFPIRSALALLAVLALGLGIGYAVGNRGSRPSPRTRTRTVTTTLLPPLTATPPVEFRTLDATGRRCSAQPHAGQLQLGIEAVNHTATTIELVDLHAVLPLGGLRPIASAVGACGALPVTAAVRGYRLASGATAWLTIRFDVLVRCPFYAPATFRARYRQSGRLKTATLIGFVDLGDVPYPGCPTWR